jgi:2-polyprenyl-3-methyl-5-hydroxy-6-metoxy-1,4-benzoquinol methylase
MDSRLVKNPLGFWEVERKPNTADLDAYYAEKYYQQGLGSYELKYNEQELAFFKAKLDQRYAVLSKYLRTGNSSQISMLDVGCGEGYALSFFRSLGWWVKGFDFSAAGVNSKNPHCLDVLSTGDVFKLLEAEIASGKKYDVVWLQNVLEHVIDPVHLLEQLKQLLLPEGTAVITVPNDCSDLQCLALEENYVDDAFWVAPPDHLSYFNSETLPELAAKTGWDVLDMTADFPVDWLLFHPGSNYIKDKKQGKAAHMARVKIENLLHQQPIEQVINFWSAAAKIGVGRNLTIYLRLK